MIEHEPWRGPNCEFGIGGQRICIVGYSHYRDAKDPDSNQFTNNVVKNVLDRKQTRDSLFPRIPGYFGYKDRTQFWKSVWLFNFIPECIGTSEQKHCTANRDMIERAKERFTRILREENIEKVFVFTTKGWNNCPYTDREKTGRDCESLVRRFKRVTWGVYSFGDRKVLAFGFRHPQFARKSDMVAAVKEALSRSSGFSSE